MVLCLAVTSFPVVAVQVGPLCIEASVSQCPAKVNVAVENISGLISAKCLTFALKCHGGSREGSLREMWMGGPAPSTGSRSA